MINYNIHIRTNHWTKRAIKINQIIKKILLYKKELKFLNNTNYYCNFILANDKFIKKLNYKYKKNTKSTDVLTFVSKINYKNKKKEKHCDIIFSIETIKKDIERNNVNFYNHLTHLIIHSFLHINDFMHNKIKDYLMMKSLEVNILNKLGIQNPY